MDNPRTHYVWTAHVDFAGAVEEVDVVAPDVSTARDLVEEELSEEHEPGGRIVRLVRGFDADRRAALDAEEPALGWHAAQALERRR